MLSWPTPSWLPPFMLHQEGAANSGLRVTNLVFVLHCVALGTALPLSGTYLLSHQREGIGPILAGPASQVYILALR